MKKNIFLYSALALGMTGMFASCSSDDVVEVSGGNTGTDATAQVIEIAVDNTNSLSTRSGRPLTSEEPDQTIEHVAVVITSAAKDVNEDNVVYATVIDNWAGEDAVSSEYGDNSYESKVANGRSYKLTIPKDKKLPAGDYNIYAVGYSTNSEYTIKSKAIGTYFEEQETEPTGKFEPNVVVANNTGKTEGEEIFAGSTTAEVNSDLVFTSTVNLYLHRQVAGIYTYVRRIPYIATSGSTNYANYLRVVASDNNPQMILGKFLPETGELGNNGNNTNNNVVNGIGGNGEKVLYVIELAGTNGWFKNIQDTDGDGLIDYTSDNWNVPYRNSQTDRYYGCYFRTGSVFGGEFVIPFLAKTGQKTLKLQLVYAESADDAKSLETGKATTAKEWNINLPETNGYNAKIWSWSNDAWTEGASETSKTAYSILRNHLYGVGKRLKNDPNGDNTDITDPDPEPGDEDDPEPLDKNTYINLRVNDNWEVIHKMEIEDAD